MTTQPLSVSMISAPLASIDRRALSQAWYSALHLSQRAASPQANGPKDEPAHSQSGFTPLRGAKAFAARTKVVSLAERRALKTRPRVGGSAVERRTAKTPLARRIERALLRPTEPLKRVTLAVDSSGARVHVMLQTTRAGVKLIAMCSPRVRDAVDRALAQVRFALAARGIEVDACS
jgi:hypothetical protein